VAVFFPRKAFAGPLHDITVTRSVPADSDVRHTGHVGGFASARVGKGPVFGPTGWTSVLACLMTDMNAASSMAAR
jgi:hypothetical protein